VQSMLNRLALVLAAFLCVSVIRAQEPERPAEPEKPKPAARAMPPISEPDTPSDDNSATNASSNWRADTTPLTGLQAPTLGNPELRHSYWVPGFQYGVTAQSNPLTSNKGQDWYVTNYLGWSLSLQKGWTNSQLVLNYSGGGVFTTQNGQDNGTYQQVGVGQNFQWRRWLLQWNDQFSYLPQTQFGFGGSTSLGLPGVGGPLGPPGPTSGGTTVPSQSIYTALGPRFSNAAVVQTTYLFSPRQSVTASGSYGLLHFTQAGNVDTDDYVGSFGYNYGLNAKDSIGVVYRFTAYHYQGQPQALGDTTVSFAYGRKITQRVAFQLFAGPDYTTYRVPIGTSSSRTSGSVSADLRYNRQKTSLVLDYVHGLGGGSGTLTGSELDQITFFGNRRLTRIWTVNGSFGFADNRSLSNSSSGTTIPNVSFKSWYIGAGISRPIGRNIDFSLSYNASINEPNQSGCTGVNCNASNTQNTITVFVQWHTRPFVIE
jgi:hypothetical protein